MFLLLRGDIEEIVVVFGNFNSSKRRVRAGRFVGELRGGLCRDAIRIKKRLMSAIEVGLCAQAEKGAFGPPRASLESRQLHPLGTEA